MLCCRICQKLYRVPKGPWKSFFPLSFSRPGKSLKTGQIPEVFEILTNVTATRKGWKLYCRFWLTSIDFMKIMQMTFRNTQSILTKLLLNSEADFSPSCLEAGLTQTVPWPSSQLQTLHLGLVSNQTYSVIDSWSLVRNLLNSDFLLSNQTEADNSTGDIPDAKWLVFDHIALGCSICNTVMSNKRLLLSCGIR